MEQKNALHRELLERYGAMIGGAELRAVLKFRTPSAFYKALKLEKLGVHVFHLQGRRGLFCMTVDIADWMLAVSQKPSLNEAQDTCPEKSQSEGEAP